MNQVGKEVHLTWIVGNEGDGNELRIKQLHHLIALIYSVLSAL